MWHWIANRLEDLHSDNNKISRPNAMQEHSERVFFPHDILTGSEADGTVASGEATCRNRLIVRTQEGAHSVRAINRRRDHRVNSGLDH
ncbi:MAG: hypothetical protein ABI024_09680 [Vicinamibacterales bacterium]